MLLDAYLTLFMSGLDSRYRSITAKRMPAVKSNRPIDLPLSQVISVNRSPIAIASILHRISGIILFLLMRIDAYNAQNCPFQKIGFYI